MNKLISIIVIAVVVIGGYTLFKDKAVAPNPETASENNPEGVAVGEPNGVQVKEFAIDGNNFSLTLAAITVNKGDTVKITFTNRFGMHDWKLDEFNVGTKVLKAGESETVTFVADKSGTFEYYCSVGSHRQMGMVGKLIVN